MAIESTGSTERPAWPTSHEMLMALAVREAREGLRQGERPFGSVVAFRGGVVGVGRNQAISRDDPTQHAEIVAIQQAAKRLRAAQWQESTLYTTCEPCPMCCGAIFFAGVPRVVLGVRFALLSEFSIPLYRYHGYSIERLRDLIGCNLEIIDGVLERDCEAVFREWEVLHRERGNLTGGI